MVFIRLARTEACGGGESLTLACGLAQIAAPNVHRTFIHYRDQFNFPTVAKKTATQMGGCFLVEVGRVELPSENMMTQLSTSVAVV